MTAMARLASFLFVLWAGVTVSTGKDLQKRIIGGTDCAATDRLYHVKLLDNDRNFMCGGSLISDEWVLTAAHCWEQATIITVVIGAHPGPGQEQTIQKLPKFFSASWLKDDFMLLKLPQKVTGITPVKLGDCKNRPKKGQMIQIAGHGSTRLLANNEIPGGGQSAKLQCANAAVSDCVIQKNEIFCARTQGVDICGGDSGGGVVYNKMIYGVINSNGQHLCSLPMAFRDLCHAPYYDWIKKTTGIK